MNIFLSVIFLLMLLVFLHVFRIPRWTPVYIFCIFWVAQFSIGYVLYSEIRWSILTIVYFFSCGMSGILCPKRKCSICNIVNKKESVCFYDTHRARVLLIFYIILGIIHALILIRNYGFSIRSFTSIGSLFAINNEIAVLRYSGREIASNGIQKFLLAVVYVTPLAGGYHYVFAKKKTDYILCFLSFLPELLSLFSTNGKAGFIACIILWLTGYFVAAFHIKKEISFSLRTIVIIMITATIVTLILLSTMVLRIGIINNSVIHIVLNKFKNYAFGHIVAINNWLDTNIMKSELTLGYQTFIGIARYFTGGVRAQGVYTDFYRELGFSTNVYTYLRGLYMDFGFFGSCIFFFLYGYISAYVIRRIREKKNGVYIAEMLLMAEYFFSLYFIISIFSYGSFILILPIFAVHVFLCQKRATISFVRKNVKFQSYKIIRN